MLAAYQSSLGNRDVIVNVRGEVPLLYVVVSARISSDTPIEIKGFVEIPASSWMCVLGLVI